MNLPNRMLKYLNHLIKTRNLLHTSPQLNWNLPNHPEVDLDYLCNENNSNDIGQNIKRRKGIGDIRLVLKLKSDLESLDKSSNEFLMAQNNFYKEIAKIPNATHPDVADYGEDPKVVKHIGKARSFEFQAREFHEISKRLNLVRTDQLGNLAGNRSYFFMGEMAELEQALIRFTVAKLLKNNFQIVSVPDLLHRDIIESCGMNTRGERAQVYTLDPELHGPNICLSGTSEMALGGYFSSKVFSAEELPVKVAAVSRCYRAEVSSVAEEKGIYRVHQFTKVEMFAVCKPESSDSLLQEFLDFEEGHFSSLGLHLRTLDMPPQELGAPAYRKYDIEAWLPGRGIFGEISSCSNCTDYQSRRLGIKYSENDQLKFVHTLNGTACAIPRMLIALTETYQNNNGTVSIPDVLQKYMRGKTHIGRQKKVPELRLVKNKK